MAVFLRASVSCSARFLFSILKMLENGNSDFPGRFLSINRKDSKKCAVQEIPQGKREINAYKIIVSVYRFSG
jgi:uncharacterized membrane protein